MRNSDLKIFHVMFMDVELSTSGGSFSCIISPVRAFSSRSFEFLLRNNTLGSTSFYSKKKKLFTKIVFITINKMILQKTYTLF